MSITVEYLDLVGEKFNMLEVKQYQGKRGKHAYYLCKCECGNEKEVSRINLMANHTRSCGCLKRRKGKNNKCWSGCGDLSGRIWSSIKIKAKTRNLGFELTIEEAWDKFEEQGGKCALTGWPISLVSSKNQNWRRSASLDRIDNTSGYSKANIQWLHKDVNWMKGRFSHDRFIEICQAVCQQTGSGL